MPGRLRRARSYLGFDEINDEFGILDNSLLFHDTFLILDPNTIAILSEPMLPLNLERAAFRVSRGGKQGVLEQLGHRGANEAAGRQNCNLYSQGGQDVMRYTNKREYRRETSNP